METSRFTSTWSFAKNEAYYDLANRIQPKDDQRIYGENGHSDT